jgi:hypothetical protein
VRLPRITAEQFKHARLTSGFDREAAAEFLGVCLRTVGHWETGKARVPYAALKLLRVYRNGDLIDPEWSGYSLIRGRLVTPENHSFHPADMAWLHLLVRRASAFSELRRQREARDRTSAALAALFRACHAGNEPEYAIGAAYQGRGLFTGRTGGKQVVAIGAANGPGSNTGQKGQQVVGRVA